MDANDEGTGSPFFSRSNEEREIERLEEICRSYGGLILQKNARIAELEKEAELFHEVMDCLRKMKMEHGLCEPRERRACSHCKGANDLQMIVATYKGRKVVLA